VPDHGSESENQVIPCPAPAPHWPMSNRDWWPNQPNLQVSTSPRPGPTRWARTFSYAEKFKTLDVEALKRDIIEVMTTATGYR
jgi:catalase-peroxidase